MDHSQKAMTSLGARPSSQCMHVSEWHILVALFLYNTLAHVQEKKDATNGSAAASAGLSVRPGMFGVEQQPDGHPVSWMGHLSIHVQVIVARDET